LDIGREIRKAAETGRVLFGTEQSIRMIRTGEAKLVIVASNTSEKAKEDIEYYAGLADVRVHYYQGSGVELGTLCGKPFIVSVLSVISPGESNLLMVEGH
jgi:large subunit ribosomal protein L30e